MKKRASGILLHITSLPSNFPIGDLGPDAYRFADFLAASGQGYWQILPLNPTQNESKHSPYSSLSAFAGNPLLISPELLCQQGWLQESEIPFENKASEHAVDYFKTEQIKYSLLNLAFKRFKNSSYFQDFELFCQKNSFWLEDFALFCCLREKSCYLSWNTWPLEFQYKQISQENMLQNKYLAAQILKEKFWQYLFYKQWHQLKSYCNDRGIKIIGDLPIYLSYDSADIWSNSEYFKLDDFGVPKFVAGVPPDYFSNTGQLWGNPVYNWERLQQDNFSWWRNRLKHNFYLYDLVRIDHFRGLVGYWQVPSQETTAVNGHWVKAPVYDFLDSILKYFPYLPIIAEDLGEITTDVKEVLNYYNLPGMKLLLFAFEDDSGRHPFLPHNYSKNCVVYTGTHDTNTIYGWFKEEAGTKQKQVLSDYLGKVPDSKELNWDLIRLGMMSRANLMITPMQDVLGLDEQARVNRPSTTQGNWTWRMTREQLENAPSSKLAKMTRTYGRI